MNSSSHIDWSKVAIRLVYRESNTKNYLLIFPIYPRPGRNKELLFYGHISYVPALKKMHKINNAYTI